MEFSLNEAGASDWFTPKKRGAVRLYIGDWVGTAIVECRSKENLTGISRVSSITDTDDDYTRVLEYPVGVVLEYRVRFEHTSGTLEGAIG